MAFPSEGSRPSAEFRNDIRGEESDTPAAQVPKHIRNAPTRLMKELGYGAGYQYAHSVPEGYLPQDYLPDEIADAKFYDPTAFGFEKEITRRMEWWAKLREKGDSQQ